MQQAAWRTAVFRVGMEYRFVPPMRHFIDGARAGRLGRLPRIALHEHRHSFLPKADDWNRFAASAGGTTIEKRCHFLNLMRCMVVAEPVRTHCPGAMNGDHRDDRVPDIIDNSLTTVHVENGLRAMPDLCTSADGPEEQEQLVAIGGAARLEAGIPSRALCVSPRVPPGAPRRVGRERISVDPVMLDAGHHHGAAFFQQRTFLDAVAGSIPVQVSAHNGMMAVAMGLAAEISAREHRVVRMDKLLR